MLRRHLARVEEVIRIRVEKKGLNQVLDNLNRKLKILDYHLCNEGV